MNNLLDGENGAFCALVNNEGQYSLWPAEIDVPEGWSVVVSGSRQHCLLYIKEHWTDMRPKSLQSAMAENNTFSTVH